ncbi:MAG: hypothetical protein WCC84_13715, partial [Candidatus Cybelea sp.]
MKVALIGLVYVILLALPIIVLATFPAGRQMIRAKNKWAVVLYAAWFFALSPFWAILGLLSAPATEKATPVTPTPWPLPAIELLLVAVGLAAGWGVWKLVEANQPPEP